MTGRSGVEETTPALAVVVMGYRDATTIVDAVQSVVDQRAPDPFEVVVVTSGGDGSAAAVRSAFPEVPVVDVPDRLLPGGTRNRGVAASTAPYVAFLAGDCTAEPGWIAARLDAHRAGHFVVASAVTTGRPQRPSAWAMTFNLYCTRLRGHPGEPIAHDDPAAHGLSFARAVLDRAGPFDEAREVGEDTDMALRVGALGVPVWFAPRVVTAIRGPSSLRDLVTDRYRRGRIAETDEQRPATPLRRAPWACARDWATGLVWILRRAWRNGRGERGRLLVALPWLVAAHSAGLAGRCGVRLRRGRNGPPEARALP